MGLMQGRGIDTDLNEVGRQQAAHFFKTYQDVPFDKIYTSTLKRAHQTVRPFLEKGIPWEQLPGLDEIDWGNSEGRKLGPGTMERFHSVAKSWTEGRYEDALPGGESALEVSQRQREALDHILSRDDEKQVLICMHGRALRLLMCLLTGKELREMEAFPHQNLSLYKVKYEEGLFEILDFNNLSHLYE